VPATRRLTQDDLLHLAIGWVKELSGEGPNFLWETAAVSEALKSELASLNSLVCSHERLAEAVSQWPGYTASIPGNAMAREYLR
jgi:hypothetical protein